MTSNTDELQARIDAMPDPAARADAQAAVDQVRAGLHKALAETEAVHRLVAARAARKTSAANLAAAHADAARQIALITERSVAPAEAAHKAAEAELQAAETLHTETFDLGRIARVHAENRAAYDAEQRRLKG